MPLKLPVVINTSPLIALASVLDDLDALKHVAAQLIVPGEVFAELQVGAYRDDTAEKVRVAACVDVRSMFSSLPSPLVENLDIGEAAVIHTALTERISTVVIDELKGRRAARLHGLQVTGSLGCW
jgi:predicted nucleic acid-binding protein